VLHRGQRGDHGRLRQRERARDVVMLSSDARARLAGLRLPGRGGEGAGARAWARRRGRLPAPFESGGATVAPPLERDYGWVVESV
jgi:hypothetical protein